MPKISLNGGPSYVGHEGAVKDAQERVSEIDPDHQGRNPLLGEPTEDGDSYPAFRSKEEGDESSPGNSSQRSGENTNSTDETKPADLPKRARTTANRSDEDATASSTAPTTDGSGKASDGKKPSK